MQLNQTQCFRNVQEKQHETDRSWRSSCSSTSTPSDTFKSLKIKAKTLKWDQKTVATIIVLIGIGAIFPTNQSSLRTAEMIQIRTLKKTMFLIQPAQLERLYITSLSASFPQFCSTKFLLNWNLWQLLQHANIHHHKRKM